VAAYINPLTSTEVCASANRAMPLPPQVASLGQLLCGLTSTQWCDLVLLELYGPTQAWTTMADQPPPSRLGSQASLHTLLPHPLPAQLPGGPAAEGLAPRALRHLGPGRLLALDAEQLHGLCPHAASFIT
jgi:hypothetical protein